MWEHNLEHYRKAGEDGNEESTAERSSLTFAKAFSMSDGNSPYTEAEEEMLALAAHILKLEWYRED